MHPGTRHRAIKRETQSGYSGGLVGLNSSPDVLPWLTVVVEAVWLVELVVCSVPTTLAWTVSDNRPLSLNQECFWPSGCFCTRFSMSHSFRKS